MAQNVRIKFLNQLEQFLPSIAISYARIMKEYNLLNKRNKNMPNQHNTTVRQNTFLPTHTVSYCKLRCNEDSSFIRKQNLESRDKAKTWSHFQGKHFHAPTK